MTNLILCGGAGTRLWPLSRSASPKQFVDLLGGPSLFERTIARNAPLADRWLIVTGAAHQSLAATQFEKAAPAGSPVEYILEPMGRNTAPAIALACLALPADEPVLVSPSDHEIRDEAAYHAAARRAIAAARSGLLATFGLEASYPETGYGYIEASAPITKAAAAIAEDPPSGAEGPLLRVASFREKPDRPTAEAYIAAGRYYWNSGMFAFTAGAFLEELGRHAPAMLEAARRALAAAPRPDARTWAIAAADMAAIPADSIDYAVMEKSERVAVVPCSIGWNDLGSWDAIYDIRSKDKDANASDGPVLPLSSSGNLLLSSGKRLVLVDVDDLIVVDTPDALLIARRGSSQDVKKAVDALKAGPPADRALL
ncbi:MAG TPA: sugar phosphate nucleotidyltransferase [Rectinemataceae bacterium]|nr:sugar phosphate nucleotidyltransferase [Rectinemataceae bacterium]